MKNEQFSDDSGDEGYRQVARAAAASRCTWVSVIVNIVLSLTQIAVGVLSKSQGLIADGVHSLSDLIADFVVLFASHKSKEDADEGHPYGHLRFETAASMVLGLLLLIVGIGMIVSAVFKLQTPESIPTVHVAALWVAIAALLAKVNRPGFSRHLASSLRNAFQTLPVTADC